MNNRYVIPLTISIVCIVIIIYFMSRKNQNDTFVNSQNQAYKHSSFRDGTRGNDPGYNEYEKFFNESSRMLVGSNSYKNVKSFDVSGGDFAPHKTTGNENKKLTPDELFNPTRYHPQYKNDSWFEVPPEPVEVKNRNLIAVSSPIPTSSIGSSLKNASHDIRGDILVPKVSMHFNNTAIEPDMNIKPWC